MAIDNTARAMAVQGGRVLAQSAVSVSHTGDLLEITLATITVPAGAMGANGCVIVEAQFSYPNSANVKTLRIKFGGTTVANTAPTSSLQTNFRSRIQNRNATNSQVAVNVGAASYGNSTGAIVTSAINTTAAVNITITVQLASAAETVVLESYLVILHPKA
jgi:hypothetical protein